MALLARILAADLFGAEMEDLGQQVLLLPAEEALMEGAVAKRQREFALGRACARAALEKLGHGDAVIGRAPGGAPLWPDGTIGSITHTKGYAAALVGETARFSGIGVDAERVGGVTRNLWPRLFDAAELAYLAALHDAAQACAAALIFSAKETSYKVWGCSGPLSFLEIRITPKTDGFTAVRGGESLQGYYAVEGGLMVTAAWF
jgi:4'-phosphopantetheinyl transferase EntD